MPAYLKTFLLLFFLILTNLLVRAQKASFDYLTVRDGLPQNTVPAIVKDNYGFMWFGTWNGLCRYDGYKFKIYNTIPGDSASIANNRVHYIHKDAAGTLWVATFDSYICRYNHLTDNFTRFKPDQLPQAIRDSTNRLRNLAVFNDLEEELRQYIGPFKLSPTQEHIVFDTKTNHYGGINDNQVYSAYKSNDGLLWLGTATGGVNKTDLRAKRFKSFSTSAAIGSAVNMPVRAMLADSTGIWLGTQDNGLLFINSKTKQQQRIAGLAGNNVRSLFKASNGDVWVGYRSGLDKYDVRKKAFTNYHKGEGSMYRFLSIAEDPVDKTLWFGTFDNVLKYDHRSDAFEIQDLKSYFARSSAISLFFDSKSNLWIGTEYSGIIQLRRDPKTQAWTDTISYNSQGTNPKLPDERVYSITEDETGAIWAGTANGLCRIDPKSGAVKVYSRQEGLSDQYIAKLLPDNKGNIWISHNKGLSKLDIRTGAIRNYTVRVNYWGYEFMEGAGYVDKASGELYFGGIDGFVSFFPDEIADNPYLPVVAFTELQVLNKPVSVGQKINDRIILAAPLHLAESITLTHADRSFSIEFAALHYADPEKNQYAYRLEGVDEDWIYTDASRRIATYANLPAGNYIFKVRASNSDGVWNPNPATLTITVLSPWWRTRWAYAAYTLLALLALYLVYRLIRARHRYNQELLTERLRAEKAQELDQVKSRFFTNISHEFRTPLTLIIDPLESLLRGEVPGEKAKTYYTIMQRNARRLLGLINQFLDLRKLESGTMQLHVVRQDLVAFVRNIMAAFEFQAQQQQVEFTLQTAHTELEFGFDADIVEKVLYNLLSNAFKFTREGGRITVALHTPSGNMQEVELSVSDNGAGIPAEKLQKVFEPFYQVEGTEPSAKGGTGVGLALTRELVTLHKGSIKVSSEPHVETRFTVTLSDLAGESAGQLQQEETPDEQQVNNTTLGLPATVQEPETAADAPLVLVVEDNEDVRNYLRLNLSPHYRLLEAANGTAGYARAIEAIPDLVVSDVMMPGLNGLELCQKLKTDEKTSHIPVILLTARQSEQYQLEGYETGADAYIGKPFSSAMLLIRIKNLIESRRKLRQLFNQSNKFDTRVVATNAADKAFLSKATKLIEDNMAKEDFSVEWMAGQLLLSRTQLYRKIKALTDQSVHEFATTIRLNKAAEHLQAGQLTVSEISYLVGYSDPTTFSRAFQKQFGITPKKYSQQEVSNLK